MTKSKKHLLPMPEMNEEPTPAVEFPDDPPLMSKKNRMPMKEINFVVSYAKHGVGSQAVREAGFTTKKPAAKATELLKRPRIKAALQPFIDQLEMTRRNFSNELQKRSKHLETVDIEVLLKAVDVLTKNHQLMTGNSTENVAVVDVTEGYNRLINDVKEGK